MLEMEFKMLVLFICLQERSMILTSLKNQISQVLHFRFLMEGMIWNKRISGHRLTSIFYCTIWRAQIKVNLKLMLALNKLITNKKIGFGMWLNLDLIAKSALMGMGRPQEDGYLKRMLLNQHRLHLQDKRLL